MRGRNSCAIGMTLLETAIVVALLALTSGLFINRLAATVSAWRLQGAAEMVAGELERLRVRAVGGLSPAFLTVDGDGVSFMTVEAGGRGRAHRLPPGVRLQALTGRTITFYSRGSAVPAGSYQLENPSGRIRVVVSPMGRVRWEWR